MQALVDLCPPVRERAAMKTKTFSILSITALLGLSGCFGDETLRAYGGLGSQWHLQELDGAAVSDATTITFGRGNDVSGSLPCNRFTARLSTPYPWFELEQLATTRRVCPALAEEITILDALQSMQIVEIKGRIMILSNEGGREMLFTSAE
jgi:heat shock protein HslJ